MEIRNVKTFIKVAELGNFSRAAAELGYAQSTVTAQIKALEQELAVALFQRNGKRVTLSAAGGRVSSVCVCAASVRTDGAGSF